jgi:hypothetical protein
MATSNSRFLLLPDLGEPGPDTKQTVVRRYTLTRLPVSRVEPPPKPSQQRAA